MSAVAFEACGLLTLGGDESEWLVMGVRPLANEAFLLRAKACEFELKTEEAVLVSELAEPTPCRMSPESDWCISSESGDRYCLLLGPCAPAEDEWGCCEDECECECESESVSFASLAPFVKVPGDGREWEKLGVSRFRFSVPGEALLLIAPTPPDGCDILSQPALRPCHGRHAGLRYGWE